MSLSICVCRSKRHKSGSVEEDADSPGGEYYHSPSSPASSSRNWTDDMEGGNTIHQLTLPQEKDQFSINFFLIYKLSQMCQVAESTHPLDPMK